MVGSGGAAFAAAVTAAQSGVGVIMVEKADRPGGTTQISGNAYWIPNNSKMVELGLTDPREDALKYMARCSYPQLYDPDSPTLGMPQLNYDLIAKFYDTGAEAIDAFEEWGALYSHMTPSNDPGSERPDLSGPDYNADFEEDKAPFGRTIRPNGELADGLNTIPDQMGAWTEANGVPLLTAHRVTGVYQNAAGEVVGVMADNDGTPVTIRANKAVVFGSGGFTLDANMALNFLRGPVFAACAVSSCTGDFVDIGQALGARFGNMIQAWFLQAPLELALAGPSLPGADVWMMFGDSMVMVNKYGERVTTEKIQYNERSQSHFYWDPAKREYRNLVQFMIYDSAVAESPIEWRFRYPVPMPGDESDLVISGETLEELAQNINARLDQYRGQGHLSARIGPNVRLSNDFADRLSETIERFNGFAESGIDEDFGRGSTPIQVAWHGPAREGSTYPNPTMHPFASEGPYYCIMLGAMTLDSKGGPVTDTEARVIHANGNPISRLYGAGNCIASPAGQAYWSAGGTLGPALTFGYIAGRNAAAEADKALG